MLTSGLIKDGFIDKYEEPRGDPHVEFSDLSLKTVGSHHTFV